MSGFNQCEVLFEIEMTPNRLREIAAEIEKQSKSDLYLPGQIVRYKLNHRFSLVHKPEVRSMTAVSFDTNDKIAEMDEVEDVMDTKSGFGFFRG